MELASRILFFQGPNPCELPGRRASAKHWCTGIDKRKRFRIGLMKRRPMTMHLHDDTNQSSSYSMDLSATSRTSGTSGTSGTSEVSGTSPTSISSSFSNFETASKDVAVERWELRYPAISALASRRPFVSSPPRVSNLNALPLEKQLRQVAQDAYLEHYYQYNGSIHRGVCGHALALKTGFHVNQVRKQIAAEIFGSVEREKNILFLNSAYELFRLASNAIEQLKQKYKMPARMIVTAAERDDAWAFWSSHYPDMHVVEIRPRDAAFLKEKKASKKTETASAPEDPSPSATPSKSQTKDRRPSTRMHARMETISSTSQPSVSLTSDSTPLVDLIGMVEAITSSSDSAVVVLSLVLYCDVLGQPLLSRETLNRIVYLARSRFSGRCLIFIDARRAPVVPFWIPYQQNAKQECLSLAEITNLDVDLLLLNSSPLNGVSFPILYDKNQILSEIDPFMAGGESLESVTLNDALGSNDHRYIQAPYRFEASTEPCSAHIYAFGKVLDALRAQWKHDRYDENRRLNAQILAQMQQVANQLATGPAAEIFAIIPSLPGALETPRMLLLVPDNLQIMNSLCESLMSCCAVDACLVTLSASAMLSRYLQRPYLDLQNPIQLQWERPLTQDELHAVFHTIQSAWSTTQIK